MSDTVRITVDAVPRQNGKWYVVVDGAGLHSGTVEGSAVLKEEIAPPSEPQGRYAVVRTPNGTYRAIDSADGRRWTVWLSPPTFSQPWWEVILGVLPEEVEIVFPGLPEVSG